MRIWRAPGAEQSASWTFAVPVLRVSSCTLLADGGRDRAAWKADGGDPDPGAGQRLADRPGPGIRSAVMDGGVDDPYRRPGSARAGRRARLAQDLVGPPQPAVPG
ncbi:hypothetical protein HMPREF0682_2137, partial [Propionibacterium acidifaciens F0233]